MKKAYFVAMLALAAFSTGGVAHAQEQLWALTTGNNLVNFMSNTPTTFSSRPITGLAPGEIALGIDFRPAVPLGRLYLLGSTGQLYVLTNPWNGVATAVGGGGLPLAGTDFGFDFNPTVDRIRVVSDAPQNLRLHPDTGALVATDGTPAFAAGDPNFGADPNPTGAAYTNNVPGAATTVLYDIDSDLDILMNQTPANAGTLNTVGPLGLNVNGVNGFDISGQTGIAYAVLNTGAPQSEIYVVNLNTGAATSLGWVACGEPLRGLSVDDSVPTSTIRTTWGQVKVLFAK